MTSIDYLNYYNLYSIIDMFINNFDPVAFDLFSIEIRWYSLAYIFGIILGWYYCKKILIHENRTKQEFDDLISFIIIGIIIGG